MFGLFTLFLRELDIMRTFPPQTTVVRFTPPTREVWLPWQEQYQPYDFTMPADTRVNQHFIMEPVSFATVNVSY